MESDIGQPAKPESSDTLAYLLICGIIGFIVMGFLAFKSGKQNPLTECMDSSQKLLQEEEQTKTIKMDHSTSAKRRNKAQKKSATSDISADKLDLDKSLNKLAKEAESEGDDSEEKETNRIEKSKKSKSKMSKGEESKEDNETNCLSTSLKEKAPEESQVDASILGQSEIDDGWEIVKSRVRKPKQD
ncbi:unnamed protein product [Moneuplotes crassus]|uniref:Uncharacterized protein n=1 Tax=Euplotes crassus TaxID=5936 RepID=A0AAD1XUW7_EUPCR|nr:unnamed protein product [Moneuplotes crassus]